MAPLKRFAREWLKYAAYRTPFVGDLLAPKYPYWIDPHQLAAIVNFIESSRAAGGAIAEIGVGNGHTSLFILQHLRTRRDDRPLHLFDTFAGFTPESVQIEVNARGKSAADYLEFRHVHAERFAKHLRRRGFENFVIHQGDAAAFDWESLGPMGAVLLDIDLYAPTKACIEAVAPRLCAGGGLVVDDCELGTPWDGSLQAYTEYLAAHELPFCRVGNKGGVIAHYTSPRAAQSLFGLPPAADGRCPRR